MSIGPTAVETLGLTNAGHQEMIGVVTDPLGVVEGKVSGDGASSGYAAAR
jgi:hypothetical protein